MLDAFFCLCLPFPSGPFWLFKMLHLTQNQRVKNLLSQSRHLDASMKALLLAIGLSAARAARAAIGWRTAGGACSVWTSPNLEDPTRNGRAVCKCPNSVNYKVLANISRALKESYHTFSVFVPICGLVFVIFQQLKEVFAD